MAHFRVTWQNAQGSHTSDPLQTWIDAANYRAELIISGAVSAPCAAQIVDYAPINRAPLGVDFHCVDYAGREFSEFYPARDPATGPGWYVYGRNAEHYGGSLVHLCARPDVAPRAHPHYNIRPRRGWHTKREAKAIADALNAQRDA